MRVAPIALANARDARRAEMETWRNAIVTHGHPRAIIGALVYVEALRRLVFGHDQSADAFVGDLREFARELRPPTSDPDLGYWHTRWNEGSGTPLETHWPEFVNEMDQDAREGARGRSNVRVFRGQLASVDAQPISHSLPLPRRPPRVPASVACVRCERPWASPLSKGSNGRTCHRPPSLGETSVDRSAGREKD